MSILKGISSENLETITQYYRVDRRQIGFIKFIFEAYDGIAIITTIDSLAGIVAVRTAPGCENEVTALINALKKDIRIEPAQCVSEDTGDSEGAEDTEEY